MIDHLVLYALEKSLRHLKGSVKNALETSGHKWDELAPAVIVQAVQEELDEIKGDFAQLTVKARNGKKPAVPKHKENFPGREPNHWPQIESAREGKSSSPYRRY
jgi:hypothetical protein